MTWWVYVVECCDGSLYTGITNDVDRRIEAHNRGRGARYTASRRPVRLVQQEPCPDRSAALRREAAIKRLPRGQKLMKLEKAIAAATAAETPCKP